MDVYQRTCTKEGAVVYKSDDKSEIIHSESGMIAEEKEEEIILEEKIDLKALERELDCMKRRIQVLQLKLKMMKMDECPDEECVDFEIELTCSDNKEICALQKGHHKLQCQITELVRCCKFAKEQIQSLQMRMCEKAKEILQLQKNVASLNSWRDTLQHEFGVCIERFEYLKHVKAEWKDVETFLDTQRKQFNKIVKNFIPKPCFLRAHSEFLTEIKDLRATFQDVFEVQLDRFSFVENRIKSFRTNVLEPLTNKKDEKKDKKKQDE